MDRRDVDGLEEEEEGQKNSDLGGEGMEGRKEKRILRNVEINVKKKNILKKTKKGKKNW